MATLLEAAPRTAQTLPVPTLGGEMLRQVAAGVARVSGAAPRGGAPDELHAFVADWFRWQQHAARGAVTGAGMGEGTGTVLPSVYSAGSVPRSWHGGGAPIPLVSDCPI